jgi:hypothetical protein
MVRVRNPARSFLSTAAKCSFGLESITELNKEQKEVSLFVVLSTVRSFFPLQDVRMDRV